MEIKITHLNNVLLNYDTLTDSLVNQSIIINKKGLF